MVVYYEHMLAAFSNKVIQLFEHLDFNQARMRDSELSDADLDRVKADVPTLVDMPIISILVLDKEYVQGISTRGDKPDLLRVCCLEH